MGEPKALLRCKGLTFIETICENMRRAGIYDITAVLGRHSEKITRCWRGGSERVLVNPKPEEGQVSSLNLALANMPSPADCAVVALVDLPLVSAEIYQSLIETWRKNRGSAVIPRHRGKRGHPVILDCRIWPLCFAVPPDEGLHWVIHHKTVKAVDVDVDEDSVINDIDTPRDYDEFLKIHA